MPVLWKDLAAPWEVDVMGQVADLLGMAIANGEPKVAVVRCNGTCEHRPKIAEYVGLRTCAAMHACGAGERQPPAPAV